MVKCGCCGGLLLVGGEEFLNSIILLLSVSTRSGDILE